MRLIADSMLEAIDTVEQLSLQGMGAISERVTLFITSGLLILFHGVISLQDATSCDKYFDHILVVEISPFIMYIFRSYLVVTSFYYTIIVTNKILIQQEQVAGETFY